MKQFIKQLTLCVSVFISRKLIMSLIAIWMVYISYWGAVKMLYTFEKPEQIAAFTQFTNYMLWANATIALAYLGVQTAANFRGASSLTSVVQNAINNSSEKIEQVITEIKVDPKDIDDGSVD